MTQDKCQGCAVQQGYVPVGAVAQIQDASRLPEIKDMLNSPQTLNNNDRAFWVLGWNECRDAAKSLIAHIAELEAQLAAVQQGVQPAAPMFWVRLLRDGLYEGPVHNNSTAGKLLRDEKPEEWHPLYLQSATHPAQQVVPQGVSMHWPTQEMTQAFGENFSTRRQSETFPKAFRAAISCAPSIPEVDGLLDALEAMVDVCEGHDFDGAPSDAHMEKSRKAIKAYRAIAAQAKQGE